MDIGVIISLISLLVTVFSIGVTYGSLKNKIENIPKVLQNYAKRDYVERGFTAVSERFEKRLDAVEKKVDYHDAIITAKGCKQEFKEYQDKNMPV